MRFRRHQKAPALLKLLVVTFLTGYGAEAQNPDADPHVVKDSSNFSGNSIFAVAARDLLASVNDVARMFSSPFRIEETDLAWLPAGIGGAAVVYPGDDGLSYAASRSFPNTETFLLNAGEKYGSLWGGAGIAGGFYAVGLLAGDQWTRETGRQLFVSLAVAGVVTSVLKSLAGRSRPYLDEGPRMFRALRFDAGHTAFPSGHTTVAFAVSTVLSRRIGNPFAAAGLYLLAGAPGIQRMASDNHWASDVLIGAVIGYAAGVAVSGTTGETAAESMDFGIRLLTTPDGDWTPALSGRVRLP